MKRSKRKYRFNRYMRRKWYLRVTGYLMVVLLLLVGCTTKAAIIDRPTRPTLEYVDTDIPLTAQRNLLVLMTYIDRLELVIDEYERIVK